MPKPNTKPNPNTTAPDMTPSFGGNPKPSSLAEAGAAPFDSTPQGDFFVPGRHYYIRTAAYSCLCRFLDFEAHMLLVDHFVYVGTDGRFADFVRTGNHTSAELEVLPPDTRACVSLGGIIDVIEWKHPIPSRTQPT